MSAQTQPASGPFRVVDEPTTPKQEAIVEAIMNHPDASNGDIADAVEDAVGDRPSTSWVSRIRSEKLEKVDTDGVDVGGWEDVDYRRMRQVAAVRDLGVGQNPEKDDLADALEDDGVAPGVVASIHDDDLHDSDAVEVAVSNAHADDAYSTGRRDDDKADATDTTTEDADALAVRIDALESTVDMLVDEVAEANERLARIEAIAKNEYTGDLVAEVLQSRVDELTDAK